MLTTSDRQKLESGNELLAISGRVINPTDRDAGGAADQGRAAQQGDRSKLVYSWTIAPPARSLAAARQRQLQQRRSRYSRRAAMN